MAGQRAAKRRRANGTRGRQKERWRERAEIAQKHYRQKERMEVVEIACKLTHPLSHTHTTECSRYRFIINSNLFPYTHIHVHAQTQACTSSDLLSVPDIAS